MQLPMSSPAIKRNPAIKCNPAILRASRRPSSSASPVATNSPQDVVDVQAPSNSTNLMISEMT